MANVEATPAAGATTPLEIAPALAAGGVTGALVASLDWSSTPLGAMSGWPPSLRTTVTTVVGTRFPMVLLWGPELVLVYNDATLPMFGAKHPAAMGKSLWTTWPELRAGAPYLEHIFETGEALEFVDYKMGVVRRGFLEEAYVTASLSPLRDEAGRIAGVLNTYFETTKRVVAERRMSTLRALASLRTGARSAEEICLEAARVLGANRTDVPFALLYLLDADGAVASLASTTGIAPGTPASPVRMRIAGPDADAARGWDVERVIATSRPVLVERYEERFGMARGGGGRRHAMVLPIARPGGRGPAGLLVAGVRATVPLDEAYRAFVELAAGHVATAIADARAFREAQERAERLAELDRAKTAFFDELSHEFRTPLTLLIGPVEDLLANPSTDGRARIELVTIRRNALRLLNLVNSLLDIARIEAGRMPVAFEPTDLSDLTRQLAGAFEPAIARAGLRFTANLEPLGGPVVVDRDLWEKIVLNLLGNALKFTRRGEIEIGLRPIGGGRVELAVRDTGVGIPAAELEHLFERFHRVRGAEGRSIEGAGIGLALVRDLAALHGGTVAVESRVGVGSTFFVRLPRTPPGAEGVPAKGATPAVISPARRRDFVDALGWTPADAVKIPAPPPDAGARLAIRNVRPRVLVADDNEDVRRYLERVLSDRYDVDLARDGAEALDLVREHPPDIVLADVMMPALDGFALVHALRGDPRTRSIPIVLLSARAGEEAVLEGLGSGADDYLVKPFSSRELLARVGARLEMARMRRALAESEFKDAFLAIAAHELRTPLTNIKLNIEFTMRERDGRSAATTQRLESVGRSVDRMERLIDELLTVSTIESAGVHLSRERRDLVEICTGAVESEREATRRSIELDVPREPLCVLADGPRIRQVVVDLLANALKYSPPDRPVRLTLRRDGGEAVLSVTDEGVGIPPEQLPRVFDRFYRVPGIEVQSGSRTGLGLGLFLCKTFVELHGGRIWVESTPGRGSTFQVALPIAE